MVTREYNGMYMHQDTDFKCYLCMYLLGYKSRIISLIRKFRRNNKATR